MPHVDDADITVRFRRIRRDQVGTLTVETWHAAGKRCDIADGRLLLLAGFVVKPLYLRKLEAFRIEHVYVDEDFSNRSKNLRKKGLQSCRGHYQNHIRDGQKEQGCRYRSGQETVNDILNRVMENETVMLQLTV